MSVSAIDADQAPLVPDDSGTAPRRSVRSRVVDHIFTDGIVVLLLVAWFYGSKHVAPYILPSPGSVFDKSLDLLGRDPELARHTLVTTGRVFLAVGLSMVIGAVLVLIAHYVPLAKGFVTRRFMPFMNAMPALGWAILGLFWFRISSSGVIFVEVAILLPFVMINLWEGLKGLDDDTMEMTSSFTRSRTKALRKIVLPLLLPYVFAAARISFGTAWKVALFAELFSAPSGLGYLINLAQQLSDTVTVFSAIAVIVIFVFLFEWLVFDQLEKVLFRHRRA